MPSVTFTFSSGIATRILDGLCYTYGYTDTVPDPENPGQTINNPVNKLDFAKQVVTGFVKDTVKAYEAKAAAETARQTAIDAAEEDIVLT